MKQKEIFIITITVFLTIVTWIIADVHHTANTEKVKIDETAKAVPLNATIDQNVFQILSEKN